MLTLAQSKALSLVPDEWGIPRSSQIHNGTLAALIRAGLIEWSGGKPDGVWSLSRGTFRRTASGRQANNPMQATGLRSSGADEQSLSSDSSGERGGSNPPRA